MVESIAFAAIFVTIKVIKINCKVYVKAGQYKYFKCLVSHTDNHFPQINSFLDQAPVYTFLMGVIIIDSCFRRALKALQGRSNG